jgi:ATP-dependent DNA helicase UvrD/PcrA
MRPTDEQQSILRNLSGRLRIAAGAGTGKTDTLRLAIVELIARGAAPAEILCLTFTVDATEEMRRRVLEEFRDRPGLDADEITVQTYHAFASGILREQALFAGLDTEPILLDQAREWQLLNEALERVAFTTLEIKWLPYFLPLLQGLHDELQRHLVTIKKLQDWCRAGLPDQTCEQRLEALDAIKAYAQLKRERNAIDYGDQIGLAVLLLRDHPEILERLCSRYRYVFLDEYQDTDVAQRELVKLVGAGAELVCAVGDVDQGIFGWRGATIFNMAGFADDFPGARTETLSLNFRSRKGILDLANVLIEPFELEDWERKPLAAADSGLKAEIEGFVAPHELEEAAGIAERIAAAGEPWSHYAVLVRKRDQLDPIFRALVERGVPAEVDTLGGFWGRPEILDVTAWLRLLADPGDNIALARILLGPAYRLSRRDLFFLANHAKQKNREMPRRRYGDRYLLPYAIVDAVASGDEIAELSEDARERVREFRRVWRELAETAGRVSLSDLVGEVARRTGLARELGASPDPEAAVALRHLAKLRDIAAGFEPVAGSRDLAGFVTYVDSIVGSPQDDDEIRAAEENAVRLITMHRAKGLEWEVVFVPGLAKGVMPSERASENPAEKWWRLPFALRGDRDYLGAESKETLERLKAEEERRLMYVAVTRAKRRLVLSRAWYYWDTKGARDPSPFWEEALDTGLVRVNEFAERPEESPHPKGSAPEVRARTVVPSPAPDPVEIARIEPELQRLEAVESKRPRAAAWRAPSTISVTALLTFLRDEEEFYWRYVRRVPSPPAPAAKLGIELHRMIEQHARGGIPLSAPPEHEEPYDLDPGERQGDGKGASAEQMWKNFKASRFAKMTPLMTEQPFTLYIGEGLSVTGRIDAIFEGGDGVLEVVDYKTGTTDPDPLQLAIYAKVVDEIWNRQAEPRWLLLRSGDVEDAAIIEGLGGVLERAARHVNRLG